MRRAAGGVGSNVGAVMTSGSVTVDLVAHEAVVDGRVLALTVKEFDLLAHFVANPGRAFRREELLQAVWGYSMGDTATITVHVRRLREKVEIDPSNPIRLCTVRGIGYRWMP